MKTTQQPMYPRTSPAQVAQELGISEHAVALAYDAEFIDLHIETFIPRRLWGYDMQRDNRGAFPRGVTFAHLDFPRAWQAGLSGGCWSITTNPIRSESGRWAAFQHNLDALVAEVEATGGKVRVARNIREYRAIREAGSHAAMLCVQGGNAVDGAPAGPLSIRDQLITRITVVHLTDSQLGGTSSPLRLPGASKRLTSRGKTYIEQLNEARIFVDLAHISREAFWQAVDVHDDSQPLICTHTGVCGVKDHWRNLTDNQLRAIADTGGTIGVIYQGSFLSRPGGPRDVEMVIEHLEHIIGTVGEDFASIGTDYDGFIIPPKDLRDGREGLLRTVDAMLRRGWTETRVRKVMAENYLRAFEQLRPE